MSERKKRFKMYKSGKNWVVAPIVFLGVTLFETGMTNSVSANSVSSVSNNPNNVQQKGQSQVSSSSLQQSQVKLANQSSKVSPLGNGEKVSSSSINPKSSQASASAIRSNASNNNLEVTSSLATQKSETTPVVSSSKANVSSMSSKVSSISANNSSSSVSPKASAAENNLSSTSSLSSSQVSSPKKADASSTSTDTDITPAVAKENDKILSDSQNVARRDETATIYNMNTFTQNYVPNRSLGVDVSSYQGTDMSQYANAGATFSIVKVSQGTSYINPNAAGQISSSESHGMMVQGYHYATFGGNTGAADAEASHAIDAAHRVGLPEGTYLACDYEEGAWGDVGANTNAVIEFMQRIKDAGYIPLLYSGAYYMKEHLNLGAIINRFGNCIWIASYPTTSAVDGPDFDYFPSTDGVIMWQYTDNWKGMGVDSSVNVLPLQNSKNGSVYENGHWRYYDNGQLVRNNFVNFNGNTYYYDNNGNQVYGSQYIWGHWRYFRTGSQPGVAGSQVKDGFVTVGGNTYYYDKNGCQVYGSQYIWGHWRYFRTGSQP
ncbi:MAG TPA: KxYKxGKxW signal peptide domain-containing protein, partial [Globicatella sulfidifaciens]|nr:KxYKxGKxW signal peptide domain-containing protein [Globicatella sulfidifaciens]